MNTTRATQFAQAVVKNPLLSSVLLLAMLSAAITTGSITLLAACGVLTFARPLLYVALLSQEADDGTSPKAQLDRRASSFRGLAIARAN